jgi:hypothetical protein
VTWSFGRWAGGRAWTARRFGAYLGELLETGRTWLVRVDGAPEVEIVDFHQAAVALLDQVAVFDEPLERARARNEWEDHYGLTEHEIDREEAADDL